MVISLSVSSTGVQAAIRQLDAAAAGKLRQDIARGVQRAVEPVPAAIRRNILIRMPASGGFAAALARADFTVKPLNFGSTVGARLLVSSPMDEARIDQGRLRHPLFGDAGWWYSQKVPPRVFSDPVRAARSDIVAAVGDAVRANLS